MYTVFKNKNGDTTPQTNWDTLIVVKVFLWRDICATESLQAAEDMKSGFPFLSDVLQRWGYVERKDTVVSILFFENENTEKFVHTSVQFAWVKSE